MTYKYGRLLKPRGKKRRGWLSKKNTENMEYEIQYVLNGLNCFVSTRDNLESARNISAILCHNDEISAIRIMCREIVSWQTFQVVK